MLTTKRDLSSVHNSDECDCEMCRAADEYEARKVSRAVSEAKNVSTASRSVRINPPALISDPVEAAFDSLWSRTPLVIQESTERDIAEYFYRMGVIHGREMVPATTNDDLVEMRRLAGERLR